MPVQLSARPILNGMLVLALIVSVVASGVAQQKQETLYKRLGGYDAIAAVMDDFIGRLANDKQVSRFFNGVSADSLKRIRQLAVDQVCAATGGPCLYIRTSWSPSLPA